MSEDNILRIALFAILCATIIAVVAFIGEPTQKRVEKCVEVTNYTEERCRWEVTR